MKRNKISTRILKSYILLSVLLILCILGVLLVFSNHYVDQQYLPTELANRRYYEYGDNKTEQAAKQYWDKIKGTQK